MESKPFHVEPPYPGSKHIMMIGPGDLVLVADFDDVDCEQVEADIYAAEAILNAHWHDAR